MPRLFFVLSKYIAKMQSENFPINGSGNRGTLCSFTYIKSLTMAMCINSSITAEHTSCPIYLQYSYTSSDAYNNFICVTCAKYVKPKYGVEKSFDH